MKEIGGYFGLECGHAPLYHQGATLLNSARNALRYIVRAYHIQEIFVPFYTCPVIWQALEAENCHITHYRIDNHFMPMVDFEKEAFVLYNNWFGVCGKNVEQLAQKYPHLIVDNAQSFYAPKQGLAAFYSPRKFFGLPDGGLALCDKKADENFEQSTSYNLCTHLLKRHDLTASDAYADFQKNDDALIGRPVQKMSKLTMALMGNIDYDFVRQKRLKDFAVLEQALKDKNELKLSLSPDDVPMVYPFLIGADGIREKLIQNKIYVARYWPEIEKVCPVDSFEFYLQSHLLPLPIDQRYNEKDMKHILEILDD